MKNDWFAELFLPADNCNVCVHMHVDLLYVFITNVRDSGRCER